MHPLIKYPGEVVVLPPQCFGSVAYYRTMARYEYALIDNGLRYDKRFKSIHRYRIADTRGELTLTVPVGHPQPGGSRLWSRTKVSDHGNWWHVHQTALESAYGRTPYFEFYIDRLRDLFEYRDVTVTEFCRQADEAIRKILGLETKVEYLEGVSESGSMPGAVRITDMRGGEYEHMAERPYWQVRQGEFGFIGGLSVLDLIFNMGPEAVLNL